MSTKKVFQRLLRTPKADRKTDLLSDREYHELASTSFQEYQRNNFTSEQLQQLSAAEVAQLETYYQQLEKKSERTQKRIRDKRRREVIPPVVIRYVPAPPAVEQEVPGVLHPPEPEGVREDDNDLRQVLDDIEKNINEPPPPEQQQNSRRLTDEIERAVHDLNVSLNMIDLSQAMPPKELLLEEPLVREPLVHESIRELDLGPPGDAGAFLGVDSPMPVSDAAVRNQLMQEFPSLGRPDVGGRFEDLDEVPLPEVELMPPPPAAGISFSTPIAGIPTTAVRRFPDRFGRLYNTDLSAIKGPTPSDVVAARAEDDTPVQAVHKRRVPATENIEPESIEPMEQIAEPVPNPVPATEPVAIAEPDPATEPYPRREPTPAMEFTPAPEPVPATEPTPATEQIPSEQQDVVVLAPVSASTESASTVERPVERPRKSRKSHKKVPTYGESSVVIRMKLRAHFEYDFVYDALENFEPMRALIQWISDFSEARAVPQAPRQLPADIEGQPILRDISTTQAELSSIREQNQSRLFPIQERPQQEELAEQQLQHVSLPVPSVEAVEHPITVPVVPPCPNLPEVLLGDASQTMDTGLGIQSIFQDTSTSLTIPPIVITDTSTDNGSRLYREKPASEKPTAEQPSVGSKEAQAQPVVVVGQDQPGGNQPVEQTADDAVKITANNEVLASIMNLYFAIQREVACSKLNSVSMDRLAQITSVDRVACAKRFLYLLRLKKWGFIEIGVNGMSCVQSISLRRF